MSEEVLTSEEDGILVVTINRPDAKNAMTKAAAEGIAAAMDRLDSDDNLRVGILTGAGGNFCAGADLKAVSEGRGNITTPDGDLGPMGPSRLSLSKPVIAAVEGYAVAGGLELAVWCDLRVASETARFGVFCRRFGVPLIDGGTIRLPRLIGQSRAMDLVLTGREVGTDEALEIGLANRRAEAGGALEAAKALARDIAGFPQVCMRTDRASVLSQWGLDEQAALRAEIEGGIKVIETGETQAGATRFKSGSGRHGKF